MDKYYLPAIKNASVDFFFMKDAMLDGMWAINPLINTEAFYNYFKIVIGIPCTKLSNSYSQIIFTFQVYQQTVLLNSLWRIILRPVLNFWMWSSIKLSQIFPLLAYIAFWNEI